MDIRITFDERDMTTAFTDGPETGEVRVVVTYPDGIAHDLGKCLSQSTNWQQKVPSRTGADGNIMQGVYSVLVERYDVGGTAPVGSEVGTFTLEYSPIASVSENWDIFTPIFRLTDSTTYQRNGYLTTAPQTRAWTASNGQHQWSLPSQAFIELYDGGYFTGTYQWSLTVDISSVMDNNYVEVISRETISGQKTIN